MNDRTTQFLELVTMLFDLFGITVNQSKSVLEPVKTLEYLGFLVSTDGSIALTPKRLSKV